MRKAARFMVAFGLIVLAISVFWSYWVRAGRGATSFAPSRIEPVRLPAGTAIQAVLANGLRKHASAGDPITAFIAEPVLVNGRLALSSGPQLKGTLVKLFVVKSWGKAYIDFTTIQTPDQSFPIQAQRVEVLTPVRRDIDIVANTLRMLMGAGFGATVGAGSGDQRIVTEGMMQGAEASIPDVPSVPITVILTGDAQFSPPH